MSVKLTVTAAAAHAEEALFTLPIEVHGGSGDLLGEGVVSPSQPYELWVDGSPRVYVVARLPGGERIQRTVELKAEAPDVSIDILEQLRSPADWLRWASLFRSLDHLSERDGTDGEPAKLGTVWALLWEWSGTQWNASPIAPKVTGQRRDAKQLVYDLPPKPFLLQVGGDSSPWRHVGMPGGGITRVAFTKSPVGSSDGVDVTVGREAPGVEILMSYLSGGSLWEAERLEALWGPASNLLRSRYTDPISAVAGGYVMFRLGRLERFAAGVLELTATAPWLADGAVLAAALALRTSQPDPAQARAMVARALGCGLPLFTMGLEVLTETMIRLHRGKSEDSTFKGALRALQSYVTSQSSQRAYLSFYGETPAHPSPVKLFGDRELPSNHRLGGPMLPNRNIPLAFQYNTYKLGPASVRVLRPVDAKSLQPRPIKKAVKNFNLALEQPVARLVSADLKVAIDSIWAQHSGNLSIDVQEDGRSRKRFNLLPSASESPMAVSESTSSQVGRRRRQQLAKQSILIFNNDSENEGQ